MERIDSVADEFKSRHVSLEKKELRVGGETAHQVDLFLEDDAKSVGPRHQRMRAAVSQPLEVSWNSVQGPRDYQEDRMTYHTDPESGISQYWICDGHAGHGTADWWIQRLTSYFFPLLNAYQTASLRLPQKSERKKLWEIFEKDVKHLIIRMEWELYKEMTTMMSNQQRAKMGGCMIIGTVFMPHAGRICTISLGDAHLMIAKPQVYKGRKLRESKRVLYGSLEHKPTRTQEMERIARAKGFVQNRRAQGTLAASRAAGDPELKLIRRSVDALNSLHYYEQTPLTSFVLVSSPNRHHLLVQSAPDKFRPIFTTLPETHAAFVETQDEKGLRHQTQMYHPVLGPVSTEPEVAVITYSPKHIEWVVLASDGLWDVIRHRALLNFLDDLIVRDPNADVAEHLVEHALALGTEDNTTVIAIRLSQDSTSVNSKQEKPK